MQWKQGVVIYMMLYNSLLYNTTPITLTLLRPRHDIFSGAVRPIFVLRIFAYKLYYNLYYTLHYYTILTLCYNLLFIRVLRSIFKLRIFEFGVWVKRILKRRRWTFLARRLISYLELIPESCSDSDSANIFLYVLYAAECIM